jgi:hypothetical protein
MNDRMERHGLGVYLYLNGRLYEGQWENGQRNGRGFELFTNGAKYVG